MEGNKSTRYSGFKMQAFRQRLDQISVRAPIDLQHNSDCDIVAGIQPFTVGGENVPSVRSVQAGCIGVH